MKAFYTLILFLLAGTVYGQSNLSACQGSDFRMWSNCFGISTESNGDKYTGEFKDGKKHGKGTFNFLANNSFKGDKYVGEFKDDRRNGQGTYTHSFGNGYVGEFKDNNFSGQGTYIYADGGKYVGEFQNNLLNGYGISTFVNGNKYVGNYKGGKLNGQGTFFFADGKKYLGEFKDDKYNGQGIFYSANGSIEQSGIYKDGALVTSQYIDPNSFTRIAHEITVPIVSESQSNLPACKGGDMSRWNNCFGTSNYASGNKFVGEFKNGQHNGQGTFTYANGNKYSGEHKDGKFFGQGIFTFTNGIVQIGEWKDEKPHGRFIEYSAGKIVVRSGLFEDGKLITSQFIDPNSFTRISPSSIPLVVSDTQRFDSEQSNLQLEQERRLLSEERRKFDEEKRQREQAKTNQRINLQVNNTQPSAEGDVTITVQTNADTASLKINGEEQGGRPDGNYTLKSPP